MENKYEGLEITQIYISYGMVVGWSCPSIGFGTLIFYEDKDKNVLVDDEYMGAEFCKAVMNLVIDKLVKRS